jgi:hypothetical protein
MVTRQEAVRAAFACLDAVFAEDRVRLKELSTIGSFAHARSTCNRPDTNGLPLLLSRFPDTRPPSCSG